MNPIWSVIGMELVLGISIGAVAAFLAWAVTRHVRWHSGRIVFVSLMGTGAGSLTAMIVWALMASSRYGILAGSPSAQLVSAIPVLIGLAALVFLDRIHTRMLDTERMTDPDESPNDCRAAHHNVRPIR